MIKPKVVLLIFVSGKIVLTGAKVREEIYMAFNQIYSVLVGELRGVYSRSLHSENCLLWILSTWATLITPLPPRIHPHLRSPVNSR